MQKDEFRKAEKITLQRHMQQKFRQNFAVFTQVMRLVREFKAKSILLYIAKPYEIDLIRYRKKFARKCKIFVPLMKNQNLKMVKLRYPFFKRKFGIYEPADSLAVAKVDLAVIPAICVDKNLKRIGHGFGFYDRFFEGFSKKPLLVFVSINRAFKMLNLGQKHDIRADFYINPHEFFYRKNNGNFNHHHRRDRRICGRGTRIYSR